VAELAAAVAVPQGHGMERIRYGPDGLAYPRVVQLEITSHCNAVCFFCAHTWSTRAEQHMPAALFRSLVDEMAAWAVAVQEVYVMGLGEPLLHPDWRALYAYAAPRVPAALTTNCSLLDTASIEHLLGLPFYEVAFSLDTLHPGRHRSIRGFEVERVAPKITQVLDHLRRQPTSTRIIVATTLTHQTVGDMQPLYDWLVPQLEGVPQASWIVKQVGAFPDIKGVLPPMTLTASVALPPHPQVHVAMDEASLRPHCALWYDRINILSNGAAVPCCHQAHDHNRIGNAAATPLLALFNSPAWRDSQVRFAQREAPGGWDTIPYCKDCR